jgi:tRNA A-37 threonylcarbamoyl transferase component Bud32
MNLGSPQHFTTARSSLASYATAPSGPRRMWTPHDGPGRSNAPTGADVDTANDLDTKAFESFIGKIIREIVDCGFEGSGHVYSHQFRATIRRQLQPLRKPLPPSDPKAVKSLEVLIDAVMTVIHKSIFKQFQQGSAITQSAILKDRIAVRIYGLAFSQPNLQDLVPKSFWERGRVFSSEWLTHLDSRGIILDSSIELDWSGRGQHIEYTPEDEGLIPLTVENPLGFSASAIVESVKCRRIRLARKKIKCHKKLTKKDAVKEVEHLQRLPHRHVVRVVGTYTLKKDLAILLYPVADCDLDEFLDELLESEEQLSDMFAGSLCTFVGCLSNAINFIHSNYIKHLDIKPSNLLVRWIGQKYRIYVADFGIARAYESAEESYTNSPTSFTRIYAAPEVILQDTRGFPADIFSLGCVFMEILATLVSAPGYNERDHLSQLRDQGEDNSYHTNLDAVFQWHANLTSQSTPGFENHKGRLARWYGFNQSCPLLAMMSTTPDLRPSASALKDQTSSLCCGMCDYGPEPFEAIEAAADSIRDTSND